MVQKKKVPREIQSEKEWLDSVTAKMTPDELKALAQNLEDVAVIRAREMGDTTPDHLRGTPRDVAVQALAAEFLKILREPEARATFIARFQDATVSYEEIGARFGGGVSRERIRQLYEGYWPNEYKLRKQARRTG